jgi:hypothetical protein
MKDTFISIVIGTTAYNVDKTHVHFDAIREAIRVQDWDRVTVLLEPRHFISERLNPDDEDNNLQVDYESETITYHGVVLHNTLTNRIFSMWREGFSVTPMVLFLKNLMNNPSNTAINELYSFLDSGDMPITEDGHFLAYKKVKEDYLDIFSGKIDNSVGSVCEMPRNLVDDTRYNTCSAGLHFCSRSYLQHYGSAYPGQDRVVIVKINPADVVSIPVDYNNTKGRCSRYVVYGEFVAAEVDTRDMFDKPVYPGNERSDIESDNMDDDHDDTDDNDEYIYITERKTHSSLLRTKQ